MEIKNAICFSSALPRQEAVGHLRILAPLRRANINLLNNSTSDYQTSVKQIPEADVVIIQRDFPRYYYQYQEVVKTARQHKRPIVFELDDLLFFLPEKHPDRLQHHFVTALLPMFQAILEADVVVVSTPALAQVLSEFTPNVAIFPNYLDDTIWSLRPPKDTLATEDTVTIGYMGTASHLPDIEYLTPVLRKLLEKYAGKVHLRFWGVEPPSPLRDMPNVKWEQTYLPNYKQFVEYFQTQTADLVIAPLEDNLFNRCKSPIKFFEYSAWGAAGVYSHIVYGDVVQHEHSGFIASTLEEWETHLERLIQDPVLRSQIAIQAQEDIASHWLLSASTPLWSEVVAQALEKSQPSNFQLLLPILKSLNAQLHDGFVALAAQPSGLNATQDQVLESQAIHLEQLQDALVTLTARVQIKEQEIHDLRGRLQRAEIDLADSQARIQELNTLVAQQKQKILELEKEILTYALSYSWQMTRPFRKAHRIIRQLAQRL